MDVLRVCKTHKVFWDAARTRSSTIIWYRVPDTTPFFPGPHCFSSETYDTCHWFNPGAGEDYETGPTWYDGSPPASFSATSFCGEPEWFADGAPSNAPPLPRDAAGLPACCATVSTSGPAGSAGSQPVFPLPSGVGPPETVNCGGCTVMPSVWIVEPLGHWTNGYCFACQRLIGGHFPIYYFPKGSQSPLGTSGGCFWLGPIAQIPCELPNVPTLTGAVWWMLAQQEGDWALSLLSNLASPLLQGVIAQKDFACLGVNDFPITIPPASSCFCDKCIVRIVPG